MQALISQSLPYALLAFVLTFWTSWTGGDILYGTTRRSRAYIRVFTELLERGKSVKEIVLRIEGLVLPPELSPHHEFAKPRSTSNHLLILRSLYLSF